MKDATRQEEALRQEIVSFLPRLRRFAGGLAGDPDKADDLVQAACERALGRLGQVRAGTRLDSWLYRIIYTRWIDKLRRGKTRSANLVVMNNENISNNTTASSTRHLNTVVDIKTALNRLPEESRAAIMLICVEGYSYSEASAVLNVPAGTVASRVARARMMLGKLMSRPRPQLVSQPEAPEKEKEKNEISIR